MIVNPTNTLVEDYTWFAPFDPAFRQPPDAPDGDSPAAAAAHEKAIAEHAAAWTRAVETGNYEAVTLPGHRPTAFIVRHLSGMRKRRLFSALMGSVGAPEFDAAIVRACLRSVHEPDYTPKQVTAYGGLEVGDEALIDWLDRADHRLVGALAATILKKAAPPGK